jgi:anti-sigma28 factor (negative regulator of flagellin synthesis)
MNCSIMTANDPILSSPAPAGAPKTTETVQSGQRLNSADPAVSAAGNDDSHLAELVRNLRALAADSPERQARIEQIARDYEAGSYKVDAEATASRIIDDGLAHS